MIRVPGGLVVGIIIATGKEYFSNILSLSTLAWHFETGVRIIKPIHEYAEITIMILNPVGKN